MKSVFEKKVHRGRIEVRCRTPVDLIAFVRANNPSEKEGGEERKGVDVTIGTVRTLRERYVRVEEREGGER
jgi:hypothetical protein